MYRRLLQPGLTILLLDLFLLLTTPFFIGPMGALTFIMLYPLPALLLIPGLNLLRPSTFVNIQALFNTASVVARVLLMLVVVLSVFSANIMLPQYSGLLENYSEPSVNTSWDIVYHIASQIFMFTLLVKTYNKYFSYKYGAQKNSETLAKYVLEFYVFIIGYICTLISIHYVITGSKIHM